MNSPLTSISTYRLFNYYEKTVNTFLCHWTCWYDNVILLIWLLANTKIIIISRPHPKKKKKACCCHCCSLVVLSWYDNVILLIKVQRMQSLKFQVISIQGKKNPSNIVVVRKVGISKVLDPWYQKFMDFEL